MILIAVVISTLYRVMTRDKNISSDSPLKEYTFFESTLKIQVPFELTEKLIDSPNPQMVEKAWDANYESKNGFFMALCYKLNPGVKLITMDKGVELMLKSFDKSRDTHSSIESQDSIVINNIHFKRFIGVQKYNYSDPINKKENFNFEALTTCNSKYGYMIYFDENINTADAQILKGKIFNSLIINTL